ncbi:hypothetical protein COLO4_07262 [Corchorus olitorius]|uniref:Uncharacterized protein n=1 Tax=Corchorus olitorius TaxID=93759 RepID=A0A1R3KKC1_9ROSI|nr:hypothetical protein COLO4_07262 [Corchorus olitorius]
MKKPFRKLGKVHPSPPPPPTIADSLSLLPETILTLTAALSLEDKQVLAYLISCCGSSSATTTTRNKNNFPAAGDHCENTSKINRIDLGVDFDTNKEHDPTFECSCFRCYMSFWARWDKSPNREVIHEIIEAYEEGLFREKKQVKKNKKGKRKRVFVHGSKLENNKESVDLKEQLEFVEIIKYQGGDHEEGDDIDQLAEYNCSEKGSNIRKIVNFIGDSIWGVIWNTNY